MNEKMTDFDAGLPTLLAAVGGGDYKTVGIWAGVIAAIFAFLWFTGNLGKLRNYILETREELRKCSWPSWDELKGSTVVVIISIFALAAFTVVVDSVLVLLVNQMAKV